MTRLAPSALALGAFLGLTLVHCGKKQDAPHRNVSPPGSSTAVTRAPLASASSAPVVSSAPAGTLRTVSAAALRASIRASGAKGAIVNAWASWCGPCRGEVPMLQGLARNLKPQHVDVILVSVDEPEDSSKALAFLASLDITLPVYLAERPLGPFKQGMHPSWPGMIPATFLFDADGKARYFWGGPVEENEIVPIVEGFLAGKNIDGESDFTLAPGRVEH